MPVQHIFGVYIYLNSSHIIFSFAHYKPLGNAFLNVYVICEPEVQMTCYTEIYIYFFWKQAGTFKNFCLAGDWTDLLSLQPINMQVAVLRGKGRKRESPDI